MATAGFAEMADAEQGLKCWSEFWFMSSKDRKGNL